MNELRRRPEGLERHHLEHGLKQAPRETYRGVDYAVAVGGPFRVTVPVNDYEDLIMRDHPDGYYEIAWALFRDEVPWIGGFNVIDRNHDLDKMWTEHTREKARFNAARAEARWAIDNGAAETLKAER